MIHRIDPQNVIASFTLGIDLGSETLAFSAARGASPQVGSFSDGPTTVAAVYLPRDKPPVIGGKAIRMAVTSPKRLVRHAKRRLLEAADEVIPGTDMTPIQALGHQLTYCMQEAERVFPDITQYLDGTSPREELRVAVTIPAQFGPVEQARYDKAAALAGIRGGIDVFVSEPVAAILSSGDTLSASLKERDVIGVIDLGGGTTDITIVRYENGSYSELVANRGSAQLGGLNWTVGLASHIAQEVGLSAVDGFDEIDGLTLAAVPSKHRRLALKVWDAAEVIKRELSIDEEANTSIEIEDHVNPITVDAETFLRLSERSFKELLRVTHESLDGSGIKSWGDVQHVVIAGGAAAMRNARETIAQATERGVQDVLVNGDRTHAIASGAVIKACLPEATSVAVPGGVAIEVVDPLTQEKRLKWFIGTGEAIPSTGRIAEQLGQQLKGFGHTSNYELRLFSARPGVRKVVRDGTLIGPITEGIPFSALRFQRDLPEALHEIALGIHVQPTGRIRTTIGFPGLDVETIDSEVGESSGKQPHESGDTAVLIITDCSSSMGIECPPRIESARTATEKVVSDWGGRSGKQLGLVVFGMKTALVAPLGSTPEALIKAAAQMKAHGSTPMARAFEVAERAFSECDAAQKVAVVISDGSPNSFESAAAAAERLGKQARIYAIGVGENACEIFLKQIVSNESDYRHTSARGLVAELGRVVGPILSPAAHALTKGASNVAQ